MERDYDNMRYTANLSYQDHGITKRRRRREQVKVVVLWSSADLEIPFSMRRTLVTVDCSVTATQSWSSPWWWDALEFSGQGSSLQCSLEIRGTLSMTLLTTPTHVSCYKALQSFLNALWRQKVHYLLFKYFMIDLVHNITTRVLQSKALCSLITPTLLWRPGWEGWEAHTQARAGLPPYPRSGPSTRSGLTNTPDLGWGPPLEGLEFSQIRNNKLQGPWGWWCLSIQWPY